MSSVLVGRKQLTVDQLREWIAAEGITYIPHHECGICGEPVGFQIIDGEPYFNGNCDCAAFSVPERYTWDEFAVSLSQLDVVKT